MTMFFLTAVGMALVAAGVGGAVAWVIGTVLTRRQGKRA